MIHTIKPSDYNSFPELIDIIENLPATITSLNLSENNLGQRTGEELATAFAALPATITSLNLSGNRLWQKTGEELATAFAALPATITNLDLNFNNLGLKTGEELATAFATLPATITSLDLSANNLSKIGSVKKVGDILLRTGKNIILTDNDNFSIHLKEYINLQTHRRLAIALNSSQAMQHAFTPVWKGVDGDNGHLSAGELLNHIDSFSPKAVPSGSSQILFTTFFKSCTKGEEAQPEETTQNTIN